MPPDGDYWVDLFPAYVASGVGLAFVFVPMSLAALSGDRRPIAGVASGLLNTSQQIGGAIGVAIVCDNLDRAHGDPDRRGPAAPRGVDGRGGLPDGRSGFAPPSRSPASPSQPESSRPATCRRPPRSRAPRRRASAPAPELPDRRRQRLAGRGQRPPLPDVPITSPCRSSARRTSSTVEKRASNGLPRPRRRSTASQ